MLFAFFVAVSALESKLMLARIFADRWWLGCLQAVLILVAYSRIGEAGFIWDDDAHLTENACVLRPSGLIDIWMTHQARICPLTLSSFWLQYRVFGLNPVPYHWVNVFFFVANAALLWLVLEKLRVPGAWLGATIWALHPVQVETAAWITEHKNTLSGFFFLASILAFLKSRSDNEKDSRWTYSASIILGFLAMASKSSTVVLPVILVLCLFWQDREWNRQSLRKILPFFAMAIVAGLLSIWTQFGEGGFDSRYSRGFIERVGVSGWVVWFYLIKLAWPAPLMFVYPRFEFEASNVLHWIPFLSMIAILLIGWRYRHGRWRFIWTTWGCYVVALLPVLGLVDHYFLRYSFVGDHFQYLASMVVAACAGCLIVAWSEAVLPSRPYPWIAVACCLFALLGWRTYSRVPTFFSDRALWEESRRLNPNSWLANNNFGVVLQKEARSEEAIPYFRRAIEINPHDETALHDLGVLLNLQGKHDEAVLFLQRSVEERPEQSMLHNDLAAALRMADRNEESIEALKKALALDPENRSAASNFGEMMLVDAKYDEAAKFFRKLVDADPNNLANASKLARALEGTGDVRGALELWRNVVTQKLNEPQYVVSFVNKLILLGALDEATELAEKIVEGDQSVDAAYYSLGSIALRRNRLQEAVAFFEKSVAVNDQNFEAHNNLGVARYDKQNPEPAIAHWRKSLAAGPQFIDPASNLGKVLTDANRTKEAIEVYEAFLETSPDAVTILERLAWIRATNPDDTLRNAKQAVTLAERAVLLTDRQNPICLRTLAAAYAEAGRFEEAVGQVEAIGDLPKIDSSLRAKLVFDLGFYRQRRPRREGISANTD